MTEYNTRTGLMAVVADKIRRRRLALNISQAELALAVGLNRTSITNIECGRQAVQIVDLPLFAEALGVTTGWLVTA